ncbi:hypothetical protein AURDEDRAFT_150643 [Auricularia subglabra TFB-10046 SS5]|nr:hypothetical protein AURDEDRAFT_150643 [Auricularia subglabra TFB-10046 SS5]
MRSPAAFLPFALVIFLRLILPAVALATTGGIDQLDNPQNQKIPREWDKCISAGIAELWRNQAANPLSLNMGCSLPRQPCVLNVCDSSPEVKGDLETYVRANCGNDVTTQIQNIETNCWQFVDYSAVTTATAPPTNPPPTGGTSRTIVQVTSLSAIAAALSVVMTFL